ncbi:hypothetical protein GCM10022226_34270 [Sphaerisporangium flaviroseum]|uniref:DDE Tnp4 domain-containing protein n=1 Tax=Sphaerisporangium flaviroseum TaxID=509199 RepID=A0ABP7I5Z0_9ACTN
MLFYRAAVDLSRSTLNYVAGLIRRHRKRIGSTWRLLNPGQQALLVLVYLRKDETSPRSARGSGCQPTAWRYVEETVVIAGPDGTILWTSGALPGKTHDLTAARVWGILRELRHSAELLGRHARRPVASLTQRTPSTWGLCA